MDLKPDVEGKESDAGQHGDDEAQRDHPLGNLCLAQVVGLGRQFPRSGLAAVIRLLLGEQGPGRCGRRRADHAPRARGYLVLAVSRLAVAADLAHEFSVFPRCFAVIHIAASTMKNSMPRNATRPSVTGPIRPRLKPPGLGSARVAVT